MDSLSILDTLKIDTNICLFLFYLFISDLAMSSEIKDDEDVHSEEEINQDNDEQLQEIDQPPLSSENNQTEEITKEISSDDQQEIEPPLSTLNDQEISSTEVIIEEEEEDPTSAIISEENSLALPASEEDNTPVDTIPSESSTQSDDTHKLLQMIVDKSNKEASSTILNTVGSPISSY